MSETVDVVLIKLQADISQYQTKLAELTVEVRKLSDEQGKAADDQKKSSAELASASQKRKAALVAEEAELKKLQAGLKNAFSVPDIEKFNSAITKSKNNIALLKGEASGVGKATAGLKEQFAGLGAGIAAAFTVDAVIEFGKASIDAFLEADANAQRLKNSLKEVGAAGDIAFERLIKQSERLAKTGVTIFTDDDIQRAQAQLANFGLTADEIERLIPKLADYASATQQNIVDASAKVGNALLGQGREFKKYGIFVDAAKTSTENLGIVIDGFGQFEGRAAKETETLTGQLADQKREVDELQESIGSRLAPAYVSLKAATLGFINSILNTFSVTGELKKQLKDLGVTANETDAILKATGGDIDTSRSGVRAIKHFQELTTAIDDYNRVLQFSKQPQIDYNIAVSQLNTLITKQNTQTKEGQQSIALLQNGLADLKETYDRLNPAIKSTVDLTKKSSEELLKLKETNADDRDFVILIDRQLKKTLALEKARKEAFDAEKKRAAEQKKIEDQKLEEINRLAGVTKSTFDMINKDASEQVKKQGEETTKEYKAQLEQRLKDQETFDALVADAEKDAADQSVKYFEEAEKRKQAIRDQAQATAIHFANELVDTVFQIQQNNLERSQQQETKDLQESYDKQLSNKRLTEAEKEKINKEFAEKQRALAKKQFDQSQDIAVSQAIIKGALAVLNAIATSDDIYVGLILAAGVAATTALEISTIESQKFAKGKRPNQKGGLSLVGEQGQETMFVPDNATILTNQKTVKHKAIINAMMDGNLDEYLEKSFVFPRLQSHIKNYEEKKEKSFSNNVAKALIFHGLTPVQAEKIRRKGIVINNVDEIAKAIAPLLAQQHNPRRF
jgi:hypothetical protein